MSAAKRVCVRELPMPKSFATYKLHEDKVIEYEFVIKNFVGTQSQLDPRVESPIFPQDDLPQWCIIVDPSGDLKSKGKWKFLAGVKLHAARLGKTSEVFVMNVRFLNDNRSVIMDKQDTSEVSQGHVTFFGFSVDSTVAIPISDSGDLIVNVEITMKGPKPFVVSESGNDTCIAQSTFPRNFSSALQSGIFSDFTLVSNDKREFPVHKLILAMRVSHFDRMFKSGLDEVKQKRVEVDFSGDCVGAMLEYVYKDAVLQLSEIAIELLQLAHLYEMDQLVCLCVVEMVKNLCEENLCESLRIADLYDIVPLQSACRKFIKDNPDATMKAILQNGANNSGA